MKVRWCSEKNRVLKFRYGISFGQLLKSKLIGMIDHPGRANQRLMLFEWEAYVWVVPFVTDENGMFLKTFYPNRKYTRLYREGRFNEED